MVLGLLAGVPSASADPPSAGGGGCPDVEVVFARGTTEAPGVGGIGQAFVDSLQSQIGQKSLWTHAVDYPASTDWPTAAQGVIDAPPIAIGPLYAAKTIRQCIPDDPVCSNDGSNLAAHGEYVANGMVDQAANFAARSVLTPPMPQPSGPPPGQPLSAVSVPATLPIGG
jgi:cutinase